MCVADKVCYGTEAYRAFRQKCTRERTFQGHCQQERYFTLVTRTRLYDRNFWICRWPELNGALVAFKNVPDDDRCLNHLLQAKPYDRENAPCG